MIILSSAFTFSVEPKISENHRISIYINTNSLIQMHVALQLSELFLLHFNEFTLMKFNEFGMPYWTSGQFKII